MRKTLFCAIISLLSILGPADARDFSGETEIGSDGKGEGFVSQYVFWGSQHVNGLAQYFYVNRILERGELAFGPTIKVGKGTTLQFQFGGTTDREVMIAGTAAVKISERTIFYVADGKLATKSDSPHTLYQKVWIPLVRSGTWQFRAEDLQVGRDQSFVRFGIEYRLKLPYGGQAFVATQYDQIRKQVGGQLGLRFF